MDPTSIIQGVEACYRYGKLIVEALETWRDAEDEVRDRVLIVEGSWTRTRLQLSFIERIAPILDGEHRRVLDETVLVLAVKLSSGKAKIEGVLAKGGAGGGGGSGSGSGSGGGARPGFVAWASKVRRAKYVFVKETLDFVLRDLEDWQRRFDPSWFLIMKIADPIIDRELKDAARREREAEREAERQAAAAMQRRQQQQQRANAPLPATPAAVDYSSRNLGGTVYYAPNRSPSPGRAAGAWSNPPSPLPSSPLPSPYTPSPLSPPPPPAAIGADVASAAARVARSSRGRIGGGGVLQQRRSPLATAAGLREALQARPMAASAAQLRQEEREGARRTAVFLPPQELAVIPITFSNAKAAQLKGGSSGVNTMSGPGAADHKWYVVDTVLARPGQDLDALERDVRLLATKLAKADPVTFGLLNCKGVMRQWGTRPSHRGAGVVAHNHHHVDGNSPQQHARRPSTQPPRPLTGFKFVFRAPDDMELLQSLRQQLLAGGDAHLSLSRRVRIAKELAKSVSYVHTFNFVHKNIRPESILLFEDVASSRSSTFLVGFDNFRSADGATALVNGVAGLTVGGGGQQQGGSDEWARDIYRHPTRQGEFPEASYRMKHDIYSLGVVMLEIGLWESFVAYPTDSESAETLVPLQGESYRKFARWLGERGTAVMSPIGGGGVVDGEASTPPNHLGMMGYQLKEYLEHLADTRLAQGMGDMYRDVTLSCLRCLDRDSEDFDADDDEDDGEDEVTMRPGDVPAAGDVAKDKDGIHVALQFIERVLARLNAIAV